MIDKQGKIVFKGHPLLRNNLNNDLEMLLRGETISGDGTESAFKLNNTYNFMQIYEEGSAA